MTTSKIRILPELVNVGDIDEEQFISGRTLRTSTVMYELRHTCRGICGLAQPTDNEPLSLAEASMIFTWCYLAHIGQGSSVFNRMYWTISDLRDYVAGEHRGILPYHVIRSYDLDAISAHPFSERSKETYRLAVAMVSASVPDYSRSGAGSDLEKYRLPTKCVG